MWAVSYDVVLFQLSQDLFVDLETVLVTSQLTEPTDVGLEIQAFKLYLLVRQFFNMSTHLHSRWVNALWIHGRVSKYHAFLYNPQVHRHQILGSHE